MEEANNEIFLRREGLNFFLWPRAKWVTMKVMLLFAAPVYGPGITPMKCTISMVVFEERAHAPTYLPSVFTPLMTVHVSRYLQKIMTDSLAE